MVFWGNIEHIYMYALWTIVRRRGYDKVYKERAQAQFSATRMFVNLTISSTFRTVSAALEPSGSERIAVSSTSDP